MRTLVLLLLLSVSLPASAGSLADERGKYVAYQKRLADRRTVTLRARQLYALSRRQIMYVNPTQHCAKHRRQIMSKYDAYTRAKEEFDGNQNKRNY